MFKIYNRDTRQTEHFDNDFEEFYRRYFVYLKSGYSQLDVFIIESGIYVIMEKEGK